MIQTISMLDPVLLDDEALSDDVDRHLPLARAMKSEDKRRYTRASPRTRL